MLTLVKKIIDIRDHDDVAVLEYRQRIKSRLRITLKSGLEAGVFLPRGSSLQHGDILQTEECFTVLIEAAEEEVSSVRTRDSHLFARACYHLGNRHVPLQIEKDELCYLHDHVLDDMLKAMGLEVVVRQAHFQPESGAYHHGHSHEH